MCAVHHNHHQRTPGHFEGDGHAWSLCIREAGMRPDATNIHIRYVHLYALAVPQ